MTETRTANGLSMLTAYALNLNPANANDRLFLPVWTGNSIQWTYSTEQTNLVVGNGKLQLKTMAGIHL